jgi:mono/diheme cytochrome c family protein
MQILTPSPGPLPEGEGESSSIRVYSGLQSIFCAKPLALLALILAGCSARPSPPSAAEGRSLYQANGCANCHGVDGHGDGPLTPKLPSRPIDLHYSSLFKRGADEDSINKTLLEGVVITHSSPELQQTHHMLVMPKFDHLTDTERRSIALYIISLRDDGDQGKAQQ